MEQDPKAEKRMQVIVDHLAERITATQAAEDLGVSRKTYYEWLDRARTAMFQALQDRPTGRPEKPVDPEKEAFQRDMAQLGLERDYLADRLRIQMAVRESLQEVLEKASLLKKKRDLQTEG
jgi:transposase